MHGSKYPVKITRDVSTGMCLQESDTEGFILSLSYMTHADMILLKAFENGKLNTSDCWTCRQRPLRSQQPENDRDEINLFLKPYCFLKTKAYVSETCC